MDVRTSASVSLRAGLACALAALVALPVLGVTLGGASHASAADSVDLQVRPPAKVKGTIRDVDERESFLLELPRGTLLSASAKAKGKTAPVPQIELVQGANTVIATGTVAGRGSSLKNVLIAVSGTYRVRVSGDGERDGDYQVKISTKPQKKWQGQKAVPGSMSVETFGFAAPDGASAKVVVGPAPGSGFTGDLLALRGPNGFLVNLPGGSSAGPVLLTGGAGEYFVDFDPSNGDPWNCTVTVSAPKSRPQSVDITSRAMTGNFVDAQPVFGRQVGPLGGLVDPPEDGLGLDLCSCLIPDGALALPTVITMFESRPLDPGNGVFPAGPAITFGPNGLTFSKDVTITLRFDRSSVTDPENDLVVYVQDDETGELSEVPRPYTFDLDDGTVSFPSSHFSTYMATTPSRGSIDGSWYYGSLRTTVSPLFGSTVRVAEGDLDIGGGVASGSVIGLSNQWESGGMPFANTLAVNEGFYAGVSVVSESTVSVSSTSPSETRTFRRGRSPDVLVAAGEAATLSSENPLSRSTRIEFLMRRARGKPTELNTAGRYHFFAIQAGAKSPGPSQIDLGAELLRGTCVLEGDGSASIDVTTGSSEVAGDLVGEFPLQITQVRKKRIGYWEPVFGVVVFGIGPDPLAKRPGRPPFRSDIELDFETQLTPVLDGNVLVGVFGDVFAPQSEAGLVFLVREGAGLSASRILGTSFGGQFEMAPVSSGVDPNRFEFAAGTGTGNRAQGGFSVAGASAFRVFHDGSGGPSSQNEFTSVTPTVPFAVSTKGVYTETQSEAFGCVAPRGDFILSVIPATDDRPFVFRMDLPAGN